MMPPLPAGTVAAFETLCGSIVALTKDDETFRTTTAAFAWQCLGCGSRQHDKHTHSYTRDGANGHAAQCRSMPLPA
ncbi:hypothetical protein [Actinacidiphila acididurans]|uniref:Uncharacterized protein n=1 Tax=Actinacidiphila acididurans TaxID=2784346 RepID=A0ABS2TP21_9ACTN|nr:hypothetical protein [Actinacidiphila acididurans]MBM9504822.1 hypothetical protein [Actinacidiphila acididurans]